MPRDPAYQKEPESAMIIRAAQPASNHPKTIGPASIVPSSTIYRIILEGSAQSKWTMSRKLYEFADNPVDYSDFHQYTRTA